MEFGHWIQFGALLVAIISLIVQQTRQLDESQRKERRVASKLKLFYICQDSPLTEDQIIAQFRRNQPTQSIDDVELRKALYEMLTDQTLRFRTNGTYKARRNKAIDEDDA